jgi:rhodanese-related sulfurtransferase
MIAADVAETCRSTTGMRRKRDSSLDVREPAELAVENNVICRPGGRAYYAARILLQNGFKAKVIPGGMLSRVHATTFRGD